MYENIWTFKTKRFTVRLAYDYEDYHDLRDNDEETKAKVENGEWGVYCFKASIECDGRALAVDYLGDSVYDDPHQFVREHLGIRPRVRADNVNYGSYFTDMIREVCREARSALRDTPRLRATA